MSVWQFFKYFLIGLKITVPKFCVKRTIRKHLVWFMSRENGLKKLFDVVFTCSMRLAHHTYVSCMYAFVTVLKSFLNFIYLTEFRNVKIEWTHKHKERRGWKTFRWFLLLLPNCYDENVTKIFMTTGFVLTQLCVHSLDC